MLCSTALHIGFYDRSVDAKATTVRHPGTLRHVDDLPMQLLDDLRAERPRDLQDGFGVGRPLADPALPFASRVAGD